MGAALLALARLLRRSKHRHAARRYVSAMLATRKEEAMEALQGARRRVVASGLGAAHAAGRGAVEALLHDQVERRQLAALRRARTQCRSAARFCSLHAATCAMRDSAAQAQQQSTASPRQGTCGLIDTRLLIGACTSTPQGAQSRNRHAAQQPACQQRGQPAARSAAASALFGSDLP